MRLAIVTPYCREERVQLERCLASVAAQGPGVEHILVADGHPLDWVAGAGGRHVVLDRAHGDFGDTPRMVGLTLAIRAGCDAVQFLDADNMLFPGHAERLAALHEDTRAAVLILKRRFLRPDGSVIEVTLPEEESLGLIDTNCYCFTRTAFATALKWALIPAELAFIGDRVFRCVIAAARHPLAVMEEATVGYHCMWAAVYEAAGESAPPGCRRIDVHQARAAAWWTGLPPERRAAIQDTLGIRITP